MAAGTEQLWAKYCVSVGQREALTGEPIEVISLALAGIKVESLPRLAIFCQSRLLT